MRKLKKYTPTKFMAKTSHYDKDAADFAVMFIESLCHTKGTWAGKPFELIDWQEQIIRDLFGVVKENGYRQFNTAYIEIPKKQGKSELAAAVALLLTCGDGEERAEVYGCAADRNQAKIVFDVAVDMVRFCPALSKRVKILESQKKLVYKPTNSSYQVLSADVANKHGFNTHGVIFDELHTQPNRKLFDVMLQGSGDARMQPLYFLITTAGNDTNSICWEVHQKALDIQAGRKIDPTFYSVIYGAAEDEDWTDPAVWKKANPSLGITVGIDKVRAACCPRSRTPARRTPSGSSASISGSSSQSDGCRWRNGKPAPSRYWKTTSRAASATADSTCPLRRTSRLSSWCSRPVMMTADTAFCRTSGCRRKRFSFAFGATTCRMTCGNGRASS